MDLQLEMYDSNNGLKPVGRNKHEDRAVGTLETELRVRPGQAK
jgi:hypothetical protein